MSEKFLSKDSINEKLDDAWLNIDYSGDEIWNPFEDVPEDYIDNPHIYYMWLMSKPEYFCIFCREILGIELFPFQQLILMELWKRRFPQLIGSRGLSKSMMLSIFCILRMVFMPGRKIVLTGAGFRQSKIVFDYIERIWSNAPLLRDMYNGTNSGPTHASDMWKFTLGQSTTIAIPVGDGQKIRGIRANDIIVDEFASGNPEIFEHVIAGFAVVSPDPVNNNKRIARKAKAQKLKEKGYEIDDDNEDDCVNANNNIILAGTAYHSYNHFYTYWKKNKNIVEGNIQDIQEIEGNQPNPEDYSVFRIPYTLLPPGLMEEEVITRGRTNMHEALFFQEFGACFTDDTNGFFKRSIIEKCKGNHSVLLSGRRNQEYIMAIDPASEMDNFSIVIIEVSSTNRKVVYCWTTTKKNYKQALKDGKTNIDDFYEYTARHILDLTKMFNIIGIAIDTQGGGHQIISSLHKTSLLKENESPIWYFIDKENPCDEDSEEGRHIIEPVNFADFEYTRDANHGLRMDLEQKTILFPTFDGLTLIEADLSDQDELNKFDNLEQTVLEIEELKNELSSIVQTSTTNGRDKWDTPEVKIPGTKKGRMKKDRYSSLLMANALATKLVEIKKPIEFASGGIARYQQDKRENRITYVGSGFAKELSNFYENEGFNNL